MEWREAESLDAKFAGLEHQIRGVAVAWLVLIVVTALLQLWAVSAMSAAPEVLKVRRVEILDGAGQRRLDLGLAPDGSPRVRLYDERGTERIGFSVTPDRSGLTMFDAHGRQRLMLAANQDVTVLGLHDAGETQRFRLTVDAGGASRLVLADGRDGSTFAAP